MSTIVIEQVIYMNRSYWWSHKIICLASNQFQPLWPDWAIFQSSCQQIFLWNNPNIWQLLGYWQKSFIGKTIEANLLINVIFKGSGCGSVGRAVASDTRGLRFESSHRRNFIHVFTINCIEKTKIKKKRPGMAHFLKKTGHSLVSCISIYQGSFWRLAQNLKF